MRKFKFLIFFSIFLVKKKSESKKSRNPDLPDSPDSPDFPDFPDSPDSPNFPDSPEFPDFLIFFNFFLIKINAEIQISYFFFIFFSKKKDFLQNASFKKDDFLCETSETTMGSGCTTVIASRDTWPLEENWD